MSHCWVDASPPDEVILVSDSCIEEETNCLAVESVVCDKGSMSAATVYCESLSEHRI